MTTIDDGEQLQPDDLRVRGRRRSASASPVRPGASGTSGSEEDTVEQPPAPPAVAAAVQLQQQQPFSRLSQLLGEAKPPLRCQQCNYETFSAACFETHAKSHDDRRFYECDVCRMRFTNGANLRRHRMRHTGVKPYECRVCGKRFFRRDHLLEHMSTHSKAANKPLPWQCPICGKGFQRQIAMRAHYQNEHVREGDWSSTCKLCGYNATCSQSLHAHLAAAHGLELGRLAGTPSPLLLPHHFLAPVELSVDGESPPTSPRPSQISPNSSEPHSQVSPNSTDRPCQVSPQGADGAQPQQPAPVLAAPAPAAAAAEHIKREPSDDPTDDETRSTGDVHMAETVRGALEERNGPPEEPGAPRPGSRSEPPPALGGGGGGPSRLRSLLQEDRRPASRSADVGLASLLGVRRNHLCTICGILFPDQTLYFMHKGCHAETNPWKCNICSEVCQNVYEFNSHLLSQPHQ